MHKTWTRSEILGRLRAEVAAGRPILGAGASAGIIAKCAAAGGADLIIVYSTGRSRLMGLPTSRIGDSNVITVSMAAEILNVVQQVPVIGGVEGADPTNLDFDVMLDKFIAAGYHGIINFPTVGIYGDYRVLREQVGLGFQREVDMIHRARERDIFTMTYVFNLEDSQAMARAGADCIVAHVGPTTGGMVGYEARTHDAAFRLADEILAAAQAINPDVLMMAHGGPLAEPADTAELYSRSRAVGFIGASSIERIPIERAVRAAAQGFKGVALRSRE